MKRGWTLAASAVFVVLVASCAPPPKTVATIDSPSPSPSPTPTAPLAATAPAFHVGEVGIAYGAVAFAATGGVAPYKYTVQSGALPSGLNLGSDGSISGTPTAGGSYSFTIAILDSGDSTATVDGKISIANPLTAHLIPACSSYCNVELGCTTACGSFGKLAGGVGPFSFSLLSGPLPAGTSLNGLSLAGTFKGQTGWLQFTVQASDALGAITTISPRFWMYPHISLASGGCSSYYGQACQTKLQISGGVPGDQFTVNVVNDGQPGQTQGCGSYGPVPAGSVGVSGSTVVIAVPGGPWPGASGYGAIWTLQVTDTALCAPATYCSSNQATAVVEVQCG